MMESIFVCIVLACCKLRLKGYSGDGAKFSKFPYCFQLFKMSVQIIRLNSGTFFFFLLTRANATFKPASNLKHFETFTLNCRNTPLSSLKLASSRGTSSSSIVRLIY
ncbi:hypothetical protein GDO78_015987 [Eleutherodactylus coqui]|uniref:Uncharacterized protein n=1 Tax=Eleutherodactylus coqui TaxID=57060 RepID=A0A8J6ELD9_ELECQ|nr:hypothetical protein GDO78_015987 [Eleutherodactylus coqui]